MLYQMSNQNTGFEKVDETSLGNEGILERQDLQRIIRDQPEVIEPGLFIVAEEYSNWAESGKSIDLLGIGKDRNLVVVELKRGDSGEHMELQAIRYAAMAANMTLGQIVDAHRQYLEIRGLGEDAQDRIHGLLEAEDGVGEPQVATERPRILLVSEGFSKELTTSVLWLNDAGLDIRCVRLRGYRYGDGLLIDVDQVIPLPEAQAILCRFATGRRSLKNSAPWQGVSFPVPTTLKPQSQMRRRNISQRCKSCCAGHGPLKRLATLNCSAASEVVEIGLASHSGSRQTGQGSYGFGATVEYLHWASIAMYSSAGHQNPLHHLKRCSASN